jgi:hypothetical protein
MDRIVKIDGSQLIYFDDRHDEINIDLQMCRNRYLKYINTHLDEYPSRNGTPVADNDNFRCVGDRRCGGTDTPYFEFYDWPHIRFQINLKQNAKTKTLGFFGWNWEKKQLDRFFILQRQLLNEGWQTYDLG